MKKVVAKLIIAVSLVIPAAALFSAENTPARFEKLSINAAFVNAPELKYGTQLPISLSRHTPTNRWLMVAVEYSPEMIRNKGGKRRNRLSAFEQNALQYLDNVQLTVRIVLCGEDPKITRNYLLLSGTSVFKTIKLDGKKHTALMFVPAQLIDRYYVPSVRPAKTRNKRMPVIGVARAKEDDFKIEAVFSVDNRELARCYSNLSTSVESRAKNEFLRLTERVSQDRILDGAVLPKSRSPWAFYQVNHFDFESTAGTVK